MGKREAKALARRLGLFPIARRLYRKLDPKVRRIRGTDIAFFRTILHPGDLVFDVGANLGQKSEVFLACGARVVALEPNPLCVPTIRFECGRNAGFTLIEKAVGAEPGRATLNFVGTDSTASLRPDWRWLTEGGRLDASRVDVEVTTLDALIGRFGVPRYCKIDVEGFEPEVLAGLGRPLPLVSFEYHREEFDRLAACLARLAALGRASVNVIAMNSGRFELPDWVSTDAVLERIGTLPAVGDVFVRGAHGG